MSDAVLFVMAGGTGGHIFPALVIAEAMQARGWRVVWLGGAGAMEKQLVPKHGFTLETLNVRGIRGKGWWQWFCQPWVQCLAIWRAWKLLIRYRACVVVGFGGFTSFAGGCAARLRRLPLIIHEQNAVAGLANWVLDVFANRVFFAFPTAFPKRRGCIGNPVRQSIIALAPPKERFATRHGPLRLLVIGGSLGAQIFNEQLPHALARIPEAVRPYVFHQAGRQHLAALVQRYSALGVAAQCIAFIDEIAQAYAQADLAICRAGALTVSELACAGVASILVPYPYAAGDHQTQNAKYLSDAGAAILLPQTAFSTEKLLMLLQSLSRQQCCEMAEKARLKAKPTAKTQLIAAIEAMNQTNSTTKGNVKRNET